MAGNLAVFIKRGEGLSPDRGVHVSLGLYIEAGTFLYPFLGFYRPIAVQVRAEIPVACYHFDGELPLQCLDKPFHGMLLFGCARVAGDADAYLQRTDNIIYIKASGCYKVSLGTGNDGEESMVQFVHEVGLQIQSLLSRLCPLYITINCFTVQRQVC